MPRHLLEKESTPRFARRPLSRLVAMDMTRKLRAVDSVISPHRHVVAKMFELKIDSVEIANFPLVTEISDVRKEDFFKRDNVFCLTGTVYPYSNQQTTIDAARTRKDAKYVVAGHIDDAYKIELQASSGSNVVEFCGHVSKENLRSVLGAAVAGFAI
jgi:hypothetical protein